MNATGMLQSMWQRPGFVRCVLFIAARSAPGSRRSRKRRGVDNTVRSTTIGGMQGDDFPAAVRHLRLTRKLSFRALASLTHISAGHLSHLERRQRGWSAGVAAALDRALGADGMLIARQPWTL